MAETTYKIILFANWGLGRECLKLLLRELEVLCVVTQHNPENQDPHYNMVYHYAQECGVKTYSNYQQMLREEPDLINCLGVSVAYNEIFTPDFLSKLRVINFHPSNLPAYRGPSPVEWQIRCGDQAIGLTGHWVDANIDTGEVINQEQFGLDYTQTFNDMVDQLNFYFSGFIYETVRSVLQLDLKEPVTQTMKAPAKPYYPRIQVPGVLRNKPLSEVRSFLNRPRIAMFTGNRAEFGILFPLLLELSADYYIDLFVSGGHLLPPWNTVHEIIEKLHRHEVPVNIIPIRLEQAKNVYLDSMPIIYQKVARHFQNHHSAYPYQFAIGLGDRIETFGFALAAFYNNVPLVHVSGGDVANVPYFDTNVRHSISKLAHVHFTSNEKSRQVLEQLGEESWRVFNIGNLSYDYDRLGLLDKEEVNTFLKVQADDFIFLCTYHASHQKTAEDNLQDFKLVFNVLREVPETKIIVTYPNNDPGSSLLIDYLNQLQASLPDNCRVIPNLGAERYLSLMKYFNTVVVGNSSSGLTETALYAVPTLNIGDRQTDRFRGPNVMDMELDIQQLRAKTLHIKENYHRLKSMNTGERLFFGDGTAAIKAKGILERLAGIDKDRLLLKKFIIRSTDVSKGQEG